ncbi:class I SAM-dependent methyltransferase [Flavobacterium sp. F-65]|uniref:Class I SAM-dependent methyltransferase n=1 Tax=Flavobacterium pisciphilum TaxID=2893755 RepID=A0ABS8MQP2_9FLAO|nr:class I SAM-dependent methyltransferase [Flavobacterium sp. F-65]MCC9071084.1 class I SAM-dependent methyltransferase [Flavobacterium sp. F-65]
MSLENNYIEVNKQSWNSRVESHLKSEFYDIEGFLKGNTSLNSIELELLGDVKGKSILHLQCHFGQDTISLARLGANVTGVDLSDKAIDSANNLAKEANVEASFICCDIYDLPNHLNKKYDIVFTSYGAIPWLPDLDRWAKLISTFLNPNGKLVFAEFHPVVWMFDDNFEKVTYNYFNSEAIIETQEGTYADRDAPIQLEYVCWNHGMSEVVNSLIKNGLELNSLNEFDYSPYDCFNNTVEFEPKKYRIKQLDNKIPMVYSILATKK